MTDPIDQLKALQDDARKSLSTDYRTFTSLAELREFQRNERNAKKAKPPKRFRAKLTPELIAAIKAATGSCETVGKEFGVNPETVRNVRKRVHDK
jgi:hypothetical protein